MRKMLGILVLISLLFGSLGLVTLLNFTSNNVAGIEVSGSISATTTWTNADSPYYVVGDITIDNGANLTIDPGVEVIFNGSYSIRVADGKLFALGQKASRIRFIRGTGSPSFIHVQSNNHAELDWCEFQDGFEAVILQNNEFRTSITNSSFFNCQYYLNLTQSKVNVTSTWFNSVQFDHITNLSNNLARLDINDVNSELYIQYFVNVETVNGSNDPISGIVTTVEDLPERNSYGGFSDGNGKFFFRPVTSIKVDGIFPEAHFDYQNNITVQDKWFGTGRSVPGISRNYTSIANTSTEPKDGDLYINKKFMFKYPPVIVTSLSSVKVYEGLKKTVGFVFYDNDDYNNTYNNLTVNITDDNGHNIYGMNTKDKWIYWDDLPSSQLIFHRTIESPFSPSPPEDFDAVVYEPIYITIIDDDGLKDKIGPVTIEYHNVPDKPDITGIPEPQVITEVTEDVPLYMKVVVSDDDNASSDIEVTTSSEYVSYNFDDGYPSNQSLKLLYPNDFGEDKTQEHVYINLTDNCWNEISNGYNFVSHSFLIKFKQTPDPPKIVGTIPNKYGTEVTWESDMALGMYASDPDPEDDADSLKWYVTGLNKKVYGKPLFTVSNENATANAPLSFNLNSKIDIGGARNPMQIQEDITLWLIDPDGLTDHQNIKLVVNSTNQPPSLHKLEKDGAKVTVDPTYGLTSDTFIFKIEYRDLDGQFGDAPDYVRVIIDNKSYDMVEENPGDTNFKDGKRYVFEISNLSAGEHYHYYECSDMGVTSRLPLITSEPNYITGPEVTSKIYISERYSRDGNFSMRFAHPSLIPLAEIIDTKKPSNITYEPDKDEINKTIGDIGAYFQLQTQNIEHIFWAEVTVRFGENYQNYNTTWLRKMDMQLGYILPTKSEPVILTFSNMDTTNKVLTCNLSYGTGQEVLLKNMVKWNTSPILTVMGFLDADNDKVFNQKDAFPLDPAASIDTDSDGSPDNWNPGKTKKHSTTGLHLDAFKKDRAASIDDDRDGCPDEWNPGMTQADSTSVPPLNFDSYPNNPGACLDTDGDGLPDQLIPDKNTQPNLVEDTDDDDDGIPDWWEEEWYQYAIDNNLTQLFNPKDDSDAELDWDDDGKSNKEEYNDDTNPYKKDKDVKGEDLGENTLLYLIPLIIIIIVMIILFMYTKMRRDQLLDHKVRAQILDHINDHPGIHYRKILNDLDLQMGVATHHLNMLERQQYIKSFQDSNYRRFYPISAPIKTGLILSNVQERILTMIKDDPGVSQSELARRLNLARKVVNYHIKILSDANFVMMETEGRKSQLYYLDGLEFKKAPPRRKKARYKDT